MSRNQAWIIIILLVMIGVTVYSSLVLNPAKRLEFDQKVEQDKRIWRYTQCANSAKDLSSLAICNVQYPDIAGINK